MTAIFCAAMNAEARALRSGLPEGLAIEVLQVGRGMPRASRAATGSAVRRADAVLVAGIAGGVDKSLRTGDIVVADRVIGPGGTQVACAGASMLAGRLRADGLTATVGPTVTTRRLVSGARRAALAACGAIAVDMESAALAAPGRPFAVIRAIADPADVPLMAPATLGRVRKAVSTLARIGPTAADWAAAVGARTVLLVDEGSSGAATDFELILELGAWSAAERSGSAERPPGRVAPSYRVADPGDVDLRWLAGVSTVAVAVGSGASAELVAGVLAEIGGLGPLDVRDERWVRTDGELSKGVQRR